MIDISVKPVAVGLILALLALLGGELHGMAFGAKEDAIKSYLENTAKANEATLGSKSKVEKAAGGAWKYLKRAHIHFMGLGTAALALVVVVALSPVADVMKMVVSTLVGLGAFIYPLFWTLAGLKSAEVGKHAAKESLELLAQAGAGASFLGLLGVFVVTALWIKED